MLRLLHRRTELDREERGRRRHARRRGLPGSQAVLSGTSRIRCRLVRLSCRIVFALLRADLYTSCCSPRPLASPQLRGYSAGSSAGSGLEPLGQRAFTGAHLRPASGSSNSEQECPLGPNCVPTVSQFFFTIAGFPTESGIDWCPKSGLPPCSSPRLRTTNFLR